MKVERFRVETFIIDDSESPSPAEKWWCIQMHYKLAGINDEIVQQATVSSEVFERICNEAGGILKELFGEAYRNLEEAVSSRMENK